MVPDVSVGKRLNYAYSEDYIRDRTDVGRQRFFNVHCGCFYGRILVLSIRITIYIEVVCALFMINQPSCMVFAVAGLSAVGMSSSTTCWC